MIVQYRPIIILHNFFSHSEKQIVTLIKMIFTKKIKLAKFMLRNSKSLFFYPAQLFQPWYAYDSSLKYPSKKDIYKENKFYVWKIKKVIFCLAQLFPPQYTQHCEILL